MRILVVGGSGFIGFHLTHKIVAAGHDVTVLGRSARSSRPLPDASRYLQGDLSDANFLQALLTDVDAVVHLASTTIPATGDQDPVLDVEANLVGTLKLLQAMVGAGCTKLLFMSSGGTVYGAPQRIPLDENHPRDPICSYGIVKSAIESYIVHHSKKYNLRSVILRASNPYGPFQGGIGKSGVIWTYLNRIKRGEPIEVWGDGTIIRDYIYISDLVALCQSAIEGRNSGVYNVGSGVGTSIKQLVDVVHQATGRTTPVIYRPGREVDVTASVLDVARSRKDFGWEPTVALLEGISRTWHFLNAT